MIIVCPFTVFGCLIVGKCYGTTENITFSVCLSYSLFSVVTDFEDYKSVDGAVVSLVSSGRNNKKLI